MKDRRNRTGCQCYFRRFGAQSYQWYALPSHEDEATTRRLEAALDAVGIQLVDHIIVADDDFVSMADSGFFVSR